MHQENSVRAFAIWGLLGVTALAGCSSTMKADLCTTVHTDVLEELRTSEGTARHVLDPWACERDARRLHELAEDLRALDIRDASLHDVVEAYRVEVEHLSEDYGRLAAAYQDSAGLSPEEAQRVRSALSRRVLEHSSAMNGLRIQVQRACNL
jgi:hypothetical protein